MDITLPWSDFKNELSNRNIPITTYGIFNNNYYVAANDGLLQFSCLIPLDDGEDQLDFENNYKANSGKSPRANVVQVLGKDQLSLYPFGTLLNITPNSTNNYDIQIPYTTVLKGGIIYSNDAVIGDNLTISIIDKDNVLGLGGTSDNPIILGEYVQSWYIIPNQENRLEDISISQSLPQGLYVRVQYTSTSSNNTKLIFNFIAYKFIE
jgi:hypothetical protein